MRTPVILAIACLALAGCEGENLFATNDVTVSARGDVFEAVLLEFENDAGETVDVIADGGRFELTLDRTARRFGSRFVTDDTRPVVTGEFELVEDHMILSDDPFLDDDILTRRAFRLRDAGDILLLSDPAAVWDVDEDGAPELAAMDIVLERRD